MKLDHGIVDDLLPLYLEGLCSEDSRAALDEHLRECPLCREKLARMRSDDIILKVKKREDAPPLSDYAKKVKRHRIRVGIWAALICLLSACLLSLIGLTLLDMHRAANPDVSQIEDGVYNLTSAALECTADEIGQYVFYTNSTKIKVTVKGGDLQGAVTLWDTQYPGSFIQIGEVNGERASCTFTRCSASRRYRVICEGLSGASVSVSDGRTVSFWDSLSNVLGGIFGA